MAKYRISIKGKNYEAMADLVRRHHLSIAGHSVKKLARGAYSVQAFADGPQIKTLERTGYVVRKFEDADRAGKKRQAEVVRPGDMEAATGPVSFVANLNQYLDVDAVEAALLAASKPPNDAFTTMISLPHKTWEGRQCHALKIGSGVGSNRPGIYFLGGIHAREWGSADILINFVQQLTNAYRSQQGVSVGPKKFTASQIQHIVNHKNIYVFPQANPDGRYHSMSSDPDWRKNRRPAPTGHGNPSCIGVDLNRNFDFLWDFTKHFHPSAPVRNSTDPCDHDVYIGPTPSSEPETKNVVWIFDTQPSIRYFVDLHSFSEDILYNWGDDVNQTSKPAMNFRNAAFDGKRGIANDTAYREYFPAADQKVAVALARHMRDAIKGVRGRTYTVMQELSLYPTAGNVNDYAYGRHMVDSARTKVYSYTIEWGRPDNPTPFHPPYAEMKQIINEITAALLQFCVKAA